MAARRMISTRFFKDPDILNLSSKDTQLILIGLVLAADDEGREVAHAALLGREMDYPADQIEVALQELAANDLLLLYQVGKHRYYQLCRAIRSWQTLGGRTTPSRYPAPPASAEPESEPSDEQMWKSRGKPGEKSGKTRGNSQHFPDQINVTEENRTEDEGNHPRNVVPFPSPPASTSDADGARQRKMVALSSAEIHVLTQQTAHILQLPVTEALMRLVAEYALVAALSLSGEADAAREWIDDPQRNKKHKRMSPAFFRNWLKREQAALEHQQRLLHQTAVATGTGDPLSPSTGMLPPRRPPDLMHLANEDQQTGRMKGEKR